LLALVDTISRPAIQSGGSVFRYTHVFAIVSIVAPVGVGAMAYERHSADFVALLLLLILCGVCLGLCWVYTVQWLSRFGCRLLDDVSDRTYTSMLRYAGTIGDFTF
jgi:NhaP-type Na+/H+ or K+/H+ antiporter